MGARPESPFISRFVLRNGFEHRQVEILQRCRTRGCRTHRGLTGIRRTGGPLPAGNARGCRKNRRLAPGGGGRGPGRPVAGLQGAASSEKYGAFWRLAPRHHTTSGLSLPERNPPGRIPLRFRSSPPREKARPSRRTRRRSSNGAGSNRNWTAPS